MKWGPPGIVLVVLAVLGGAAAYRAKLEREADAAERAAEMAREQMCWTIKEVQAEQIRSGYPRAHWTETPPECQPTKEHPER